MSFLASFIKGQAGNLDLWEPDSETEVEGGA